MFEINVEELIPHRGRMRLVDVVLEADDEGAITASVVNEKWPLYFERSVSPLVLIELVAQTVGVASGYKEKKRSGKGVSGWLVGIKHAEFYIDRVAAGTRLESTAHLLYEFENYGVFKGWVKSEFAVLAEMELQLFREG